MRLDRRTQYLSIITLGLKVGTSTSVSDTSSAWGMRSVVTVFLASTLTSDYWTADPDSSSECPSRPSPRHLPAAGRNSWHSPRPSRRPAWARTWSRWWRGGPAWPWAGSRGRCRGWEGGGRAWCDRWPGEAWCSSAADSTVGALTSWIFNYYRKSANTGLINTNWEVEEHLFGSLWLWILYWKYFDGHRHIYQIWVQVTIFLNFRIDLILVKFPPRSCWYFLQWGREERR